MKSELLISAAMIPMWGMAGEAIAASPEKGVPEEKQRPNIVLFLVDDMGWQDTSLPFWTQRTHYNDTYHTPNMERLATQGKMFTQAYACSISSPTRVSLFTGMNAARHRVTSWTLRKNTTHEQPDSVMTYPEWNVNGICQEPGIERTTQVTTLAQVLKDNGYQTIHCGKAHFGANDTPGADPLTMGFEVNIAGHAAGSPASYYGKNNFGNKPDGKSPLAAVPGLEQYHGTDTFLSEALTLEAMKALDKAQQKDKPFFLYMAHYAIHTPIQPDYRFYQKYLDKGLPPVEAAYATLIEGMDKSLGDLMDYLERNQLTDNTVILFMSDNGGNLMCLDLNTLQLVWVQDILDDSNSSPVLSVEDGHLYLYISTSFRLGWRSNSTAEVPVWKIDAETGEIIWQKSYECSSEDGVSGGVQSTIAVGKEELSDYIYVTVARTGGQAEGVLACIDKNTGEAVWEHAAAYAWSSPVCVYNPDGSGKVLYCNSTGHIYLLDGKTGEVLDCHQISEGVIEASPAVYQSYMVVGTRDCKIWGMELQ